VLRKQREIPDLKETISFERKCLVFGVMELDSSEYLPIILFLNNFLKLQNCIMFRNFVLKLHSPVKSVVKNRYLVSISYKDFGKI